MAQQRTRNTLFRPFKGDENLVVTFYTDAERNDAKTLEAGHPIFEDVEMVKITVPGSHDTLLVPAESQCLMGPGEMVTYIERFPDDYERFKDGKGAALSGMPLKEAPFLAKSEISMLNAQNVHTVEQLSVMDGAPLKRLGMKGRVWQQQASEYLANARENRDALAVAAEKAAMMQRIAALEEALAQKNPPVMPEAVAETPQKTEAEKQAEVIDDELSDANGLTKEEMKDEIERITGARPRGNPAVSTLEKMLAEAKPKKV